MANIQPNRYTMHSNDGTVKVDYEASTLVGQPALNITQGHGPIRHFSGSQIRSLHTEIGTLLTVTTQMTIDAGATSFSVLIPAITMSSTSNQERFSTEAIVTNHIGPTRIPSTGVLEKYQFIPLKGEASFVYSLLEPILSRLQSSQADNARSETADPSAEISPMHKAS